jgi:hypothetical protein
MDAVLDPHKKSVSGHCGGYLLLCGSGSMVDLVVYSANCIRKRYPVPSGNRTATTDYNSIGLLESEIIVPPWQSHQIPNSLLG